MALLRLGAVLFTVHAYAKVARIGVLVPVRSPTGLPAPDDWQTVFLQNSEFGTYGAGVQTVCAARLAERHVNEKINSVVVNMSSLTEGTNVSLSFSNKGMPPRRRVSPAR